MASTDPAVEAAMRSVGASWDQPSAGLWCSRWVRKSDLIAVAREALAPVRELHHPVEREAWWHKPVAPTYTACVTCGVVWPCPTAPFCYTSEELN